jgi:hypothetical protein
MFPSIATTVIWPAPKSGAFPFRVSTFRYNPVLSAVQRLFHGSNEEQIRFTVHSAEASGDCSAFAHAQKYEGAVKISR